MSDRLISSPGATRVTIFRGIMTRETPPRTASPFTPPPPDTRRRPALGGIRKLELLSSLSPKDLDDDYDETPLRIDSIRLDIILKGIERDEQYEAHRWPGGQLFDESNAK